MYSGLWLGRLVVWVFGLDGGALTAVFVIGGAIGLVGGVETARTLDPWDSKDRRDAVIGWGVVGALIALVGLVALVQSV